MIDSIKKLFTSSKPVLLAEQDFTNQIEQQEKITKANRQTMKQFERFMTNDDAVRLADCQTVSNFTFC